MTFSAEEVEDEQRRRARRARDRGARARRALGRRQERGAVRARAGTDDDRPLAGLRHLPRRRDGLPPPCDRREGRGAVHDRGPRQPERDLPQPQRGSSSPSWTTATRSRSASTGSSSSRDDDDSLRHPPPHDRLGLPPAAGRLPRHLDLEDPLPRGSGAARAEAHSRRLPAVQRGRRRAPGDDSAPPARRVPAAAGDPPGAGLAGLERSAGAGGRASAAPEQEIDVDELCDRAGISGQQARELVDYGLLEPPLHRGRRGHGRRLLAAA